MELKIPKKSYLKVKVIPKSDRNQLIEIMEDQNGDKVYKIRVKAAPIKGKANQELIKYLSKELNLPKSDISIISGQKEKIKLIKIKD